jgi:alkylation response protein AidB-like acyl-CoA dehydrogenase
MSRDPLGQALGGHLSSKSTLAPQTAFASLARAVRPLVRYAPQSAWERDTEMLPGPLATYRRRVRAFAERVVAPRALEIDAAPHGKPGLVHDTAREVLCAAGREGLLSDMLPRPLGSADPRTIRWPLALPQTLKTEELACADGGLMLLVCAHALGATPIVLSGDWRLIRRELLPTLRECDAGRPSVFAYAITEPSGGSDVEHGHGAATYRPGVVAKRDGRGYRLTGRKCFISGGDIAQRVCVFAALENEGLSSWTAFLVRARTPGFRVVRTELKMGMRASSAAELELDDVFVPSEDVIGGLRKGWAINRATLNLSRVPVAGMAVGFARAATEQATSFACRFRLGGRALVDYQDVQLALAQMEAETASARAVAWRAARFRQPRQGEAAAAKFHCTDVARRVCEMAMDLLGNHAVLHAERVEKIWRDARLTQIFEGTNDINRLALIEDEQDRLLARIP